MFAIVSDIHGNLEAFTTVLAEIERRGIQHIVCLGDIVGYGPNPMEMSGFGDDAVPGDADGES